MQPLTAPDRHPWSVAHDALVTRIETDPAIPRLVRAMAGGIYGGPGQPRANSAGRSRRIAAEVCDRLELDPAIYLGTVLGVGAHAIATRRLP